MACKVQAVSADGGDQQDYPLAWTVVPPWVPGDGGGSAAGARLHRGRVPRQPRQARPAGIDRMLSDDMIAKVALGRAAWSGLLPAYADTAIALSDKPSLPLPA